MGIHQFICPRVSNPLIADTNCSTIVNIFANILTDLTPYSYTRAAGAELKAFKTPAELEAAALHAQGFADITMATGPFRRSLLRPSVAESGGLRAPLGPVKNKQSISIHNILI